jgi:predicted RNA methylase
MAVSTMIQRLTFRPFGCTALKMFRYMSSPGVLLQILSLINPRQEILCQSALYLGGGTHVFCISRDCCGRIQADLTTG